MYSNESWESFLDLYTNNRELVCKQIVDKRKPITRDDQFIFPPFSEAFKSVDIIDDLTKCEQFTENSLRYLHLMAQKLETTKKILENYPSISPHEVDISSYIKLSYSFSKHAYSSLNLKILNVLLKLNDKLIFYKNSWLGSSTEFLMFHSLSNEMNSIKKIKKVL
jgi:hypothetical protein